MTLIKLTASLNDEGRTLYKYLIKNFDNVPISKIEKVFRLKDIKINGLRTNNKNYIIKKDDNIWVYGLENVFKPNFVPTSFSFNKIFEDDNILVINKPINIAIHGEDNSLDNQVLSYLKYQKIDSFKPSHIGRLDKSTSGLVVYAKNYKTVVELNNKTKYFEKYYLLKSDFPWIKKHVIFYALRDPKNNSIILNEKKPGSKMETIFFKDKNKSYARIITGKKHQIRITLQKLGFPIKGDKKYGGEFGSRVFLHSYKIVFHNLNNHLEYLNGTSFVSEIKW